MADERATPAVDTLCEKYADAVTTLASIAVHAQHYNIGDLEYATDAKKAQFLEWCEGQLSLWKHQLAERHNMDIDKKEMQI